jgi:hypothetical protein
MKLSSCTQKSKPEKEDLKASGQREGCGGERNFSFICPVRDNLKTEIQQDLKSCSLNLQSPPASKLTCKMEDAFLK